MDNKLKKGFIPIKIYPENQLKSKLKNYFNFFGFRIDRM